MTQNQEVSEIILKKIQYVTYEELSMILNVSTSSLMVVIRSNTHAIYSFERQDDHRLGFASYKVKNRHLDNYEFFLTINFNEIDAP